MIAITRSELHRIITLRSAWITLIVITMLGLALGRFGAAIWSLIVGFATFALSIVITASHHQHRTITLLHLARPHRLLVLAGQIAASAIAAFVVAVISGISIARNLDLYAIALITVPVIATFGAALATIVRRPLWLLLGTGAWLVFVEGLWGKLERPLPLTSFLDASIGDPRALLIFLAWTAATVVVACVTIGRD